MILQYNQGFHLYLVLEQVLGVPVGEGDEPGGDEGDGGEERRRGDRLHRVDAPEQPHRDGRHDERVPVKQRRRLGEKVLGLFIKGRFCIGICLILPMISMCNKTGVLHQIPWC